MPKKRPKKTTEPHDEVVYDVHDSPKARKGPAKAGRRPSTKIDKARRTDKAGRGHTTKAHKNPPDATKHSPAPPAKPRRKRTPVKLGGQSVARGTKKDIHLKVSEHYTGQRVDVPVTVIRGRRPGPRLFLTAAVHGDEVNGVRIIREVIDALEPEQVRGTIIACPVVNRFGFVSHSRYMPDRRDLNRCFPGTKDGSTAFRYADAIFRAIVKPCDYGIDLHTAGYQRNNLPQVRGDMDHPEVRRIAKAFGAEIILDKPGAKGTLRQVATEHGTPTIIYEAGETFRFQREAVTRGVHGILNVMRELDMLQGTPTRPDFQIITKTSAWLRSDHGGIIETYIHAGTLVHKGEAIASVTDPFGKEAGVVRAPFTGLVVGITTLPMVNPGAPICHLVKLKKTLETVLAHRGHEAVPIKDAPEPIMQEDDSVVDTTGGGADEEEIEG